jgi:glycerophosphoryl diester phosphodiesterase
MRKLVLLFIALILSSCTQDEHQILVIGHRGASSVAPENTLSAFKKAAEFGADYFELDVYLSKDDTIICIHDDSLHRTTNGIGATEEFTYAELQKLDAGSWFDAKFADEPIPTLKQALQLAKENEIKVCIEVKTSKPSIIGLIYELVEKMEMQNQVILFSFDANQVAEGKGLNASIPALYLVGDMETTDIDYAMQIRADAVGAGGDVSQELVDAAHEKGMQFWKWTVNDVDDMKMLIEMGVDGIITNYPQLARPLVTMDK